MGKSNNYDTGTGELAPRTGEFLAGVLALSRISRVTVALESGHGAGPALLAAARLTAHAETCLLFDQWRGDPLASLAAALSNAHPDMGIAADGNLALTLRTVQSQLRRSLLIIFDRFEEYLAQPADQAHVAAFDRAFVQMANDSELDMHFLLVQDEAAEPLLARFQNDIPGLGDGCLRMPAGGIDDSDDSPPAPETGRVSRRDRSFGMLLERLTAIAPDDQAAANRPDVGPALEVRPAEIRPSPDEIAPVHEYRPVFDDTALNENRPGEWEAPVANPEPTFAPLQAASTNASPAMVESPALPQAPADPPAQQTATPAPPPRRGKTLAVLMAAVLAVGAGFYAYRQQAPITTGNPDTTQAAADVAAPVSEAVVAKTPATQEQPASAGPTLMAAPTLAAAAPPTPVPKPAAPATAAKPSTATTASPAAARIPPTVYVHVRSQRERDRLQALTRTLAGQGIRVVDVKVMSKGPSVADVRYFRDEDRETALKVQKALAAAGVPVPRLSRMNGFEGSTRPGHFEAWLGGDRTPEPTRRR